MQNQKTFNYRRLAVILFVLTILQFVACNKAYGQTMSKADSVAAIRFIDSLENNTSIKSFKEWLIDVTNAKIYLQFENTYNAYIQQKYQLWLQQKATKPKPK